ncbi:MAG TPA: helix-turn-helix domain-containing protein [Micromonosporaceae bacterium]
MFAIGSSLKDARLRKGLDLRTTAEATKIRSRHLQALEDEQFDLLPGQTYVRGFLKTYADFLGLDGQLYVDEYSSRFWINEDGTPATRRKVRYRRKHHARIEMNMIVFTLVAITGVTALVIAAWKFGGASSKATPPAPVSPAAHRAPARPLAKLRVQAVDGSSLIDVRVLVKAGRAGRLLYRGTLERGESQTFAQSSLLVVVSAPRHVVLTLAGAPPVKLQGVCPRTIAVTPHQITQTVSCH